LVHSSTLVTAGVFLCLKLEPLLFMDHHSLLFVLSLVTLVGSSLVALFDPDLKRVVALSTLSQLGLLESFEVSLDHLER